MGDRKSVKGKNQFEVVKHKAIDFLRTLENLRLSSFSSSDVTSTKKNPTYPKQGFSTASGG